MKANEPKRLAFYKMTAHLLRAYANLANELAVEGPGTRLTRSTR